MLTTGEQEIAKQLFRQWFTKNPGVKNPTDPNSRKKYENMVWLGWRLFSIMQQARKTNTKANGLPYPWTQWEYWERINAKGNNHDGPCREKFPHAELFDDGPLLEKLKHDSTIPVEKDNQE